MKFTAVSLIASGLILSPPLAAEEFNNNSVKELVTAGLGDDVVLAKIDSLPCSYDVSTDAIIELKMSGVSNRIISAMVDRCVGSSEAQGVGSPSSDPTVKRTPGVYVDFGEEGDHDIRQIRPSVASGGRTTGNGSILFPYKLKLGIAGPNARTQTRSDQPTFYFYFETADQRVSDFGVSDSVAAQSPSEFQLIELKVKKGQREMTLGKSTAFNTSVGVNSKEAVPFLNEEIGDSVFKVTPQEALESGEYGFVLRFGGNSYRIFDFSVPE